LHHVWGFIGFAAETLIFILSGVIIGQRIVVDQIQSHNPSINGMDFVKVASGYLILHVIRFLCILTFWPIMKRMGYGMTFSQVILASYAGLRGAVGMSLALMVVTSSYIDEYVKDIILLHVSGTALLTLLINATTTGMLVNYLGLSPYSDLKKNILLSVAN
jgi:sodium/hydrogen exchanger 10/11